MLAQRAGIQLELEEDAGGAGDKNLLYEIHKELAQFYQRCLLQMKSAAVARKYLEERELPKEIIEEFLIGYAPAGWDVALRWAQEKKYPLEQLEAAGIILKSTKPESRSKFYDRFRNRIMFPIRDEQNRVIAFSGRAIDPEDKSAKYVNSPETPLFHKGRVLYALDKARRNIVEAGEAIICEGQIDVIRCHQAGFNTAVASQGTAFTEDHTRILKRYTDSVVLVFDPDTAGQDAAIKTAAIFMEAELAVKVVTLPKGEDPDSFIRKNGADAFREALKKAQSAVGFQIAVLSSRQDADSEVGAMRIAKAVLQTIGHSPSAVQQAKLIEEAAERLKLPAAALRNDFNTMLRRSSRAASFQTEKPEAQTPQVRPMEEATLCEHLIHVNQFPALADLVRKYLPLEIFSDPACRAIAKASLAAAKEERDVQDILRDEPDQSGELQRFAAELLVLPDRMKGTETSIENAVKDIICSIWRRELKRERSELDKQSDANASRKDLERRAQLTHDLKALNNWEDGSGIIKIEISNRADKNKL
jgi:DNA primase